jgi:hypothetical protein
MQKYETARVARVFTWFPLKQTSRSSIFPYYQWAIWECQVPSSTAYFVYSYCEGGSELQTLLLKYYLKRYTTPSYCMQIARTKQWANACRAMQRKELLMIA